MIAASFASVPELQKNDCPFQVVRMLRAVSLLVIAQVPPAMEPARNDPRVVRSRASLTLTKDFVLLVFFV